MRISDWSSDVCSSDLRSISYHHGKLIAHDGEHPASKMGVPSWTTATPADNSWAVSEPLDRQDADRASLLVCGAVDRFRLPPPFRSLCEIQEARAEIGRAHSELQSLMRISYAVFCLKKKKNNSKT